MRLVVIIGCILIIFGVDVGIHLVFMRRDIVVLDLSLTTVLCQFCLCLVFLLLRYPVLGSVTRKMTLLYTFKVRSIGSCANCKTSRKNTDAREAFSSCKEIFTNTAYQLVNIPYLFLIASGLRVVGGYHGRRGDKCLM